MSEPKVLFSFIISWVASSISIQSAGSSGSVLRKRKAIGKENKIGTKDKERKKERKKEGSKKSRNKRKQKE